MEFSGCSGGGYEVYDPYTGNVTMLMGPAPGPYPPVGHPMLAAVPYPAVPVQALDWFNPANPSAADHWMSPAGAVYQQPGGRHHHHHHKKSAAADVQQVSRPINTPVSNVQNRSGT